MKTLPSKSNYSINSIKTHFSIFLALFFLIGNYSYAVNSVETSSSIKPQRAKPDITGKYTLTVIGAGNEPLMLFKINNASDGVFLEEYSDSSIALANSAYFTQSLMDQYKALLIGKYTYNQSTDHFVGNHQKMQKQTNGNIVIRDMSGANKMLLTKIEGSFTDLIKNKRANVTGLTGKWVISEYNTNITLSKGVEYDLLVRFNNEVFELNKQEGGTFDTYSGTKKGTMDLIKIKKISRSKLQIDLAGTKMMAEKSGSTYANKSTGLVSSSSNGNTSSASTALGAPSAVATASKGATLNEMDAKLHTAVKAGNKASVDEIIGFGEANVNSVNPLGKTALYEAVVKGNKEVIETLINANADVNMANAQGKTPLHEAISKGKMEIAELLINSDANTNVANAQGNTPLHEAINKKNIALIELLINDTTKNTPNKQGKSPLDMAIQKSSKMDASVAYAILEHDPTITNYSVDQAIAKNNDDLVNMLVDKGANKSYITEKAIEKGKTELFNKMIDDQGVVITNAMFEKALSSRKYPLADIMISKGFSPTYALDASVRSDVSTLVYTALEAGGNADTALKYAVKKNDTELATMAVNDYSANADLGLKGAIEKKNASMITLLLQNGAKANSEMANVATMGNDIIMKLLLENGGDPNLGVLPAANADKTSTLQLLLEAGADANPVIPIAIEKNSTIMATMALEAGADGTSPTYINSASVKGNAEIVGLLLEAGADANEGIVGAVVANKVTIVGMLLEAGADGTSADLIAESVKHNSVQLTGLLLEAGADAQAGIIASVNHSAHSVLQQLIDAGADAADQELLTRAVLNNSAACSKILLGYDLDANVQTSNGYYYLHHAAEKNNTALAIDLLAKGADVDPIAAGSTPLHFAVRDRKGLATVGVLVEAGADINATNGKGKTVLKIAKGNKIKKLLKQHGASKK